MRARNGILAGTLLACDVALLVLAGVAVTAAASGAAALPWPWSDDAAQAAAGAWYAPLAGLLLVALFLVGGHRPLGSRRAHESVPRTLKAFLGVFPGYVLLTAAGPGWLGLEQPHPVPDAPRAAAVTVAGAGLLVLPLVARWAFGRVVAALHAGGRLLVRAVVVGPADARGLVERRIAAHSWLGERVVASAPCGELTDLLQRHDPEVVWLALPDPPRASDLPPELVDPSVRGPVWRMLPEQFAALEGQLSNLPPDRSELAWRRLRHTVGPHLLSVAMLGSRGVPASYSGIERYVDEVGAWLVRHGCRVAVYCHRKYVTVRGTHRGMELRFLPTIRSKHLETFVHTLLASLHVLFREEEVVHYHALGPSTMSFLPRLLGRKVVCSVQGLDWARAKWGRAARAYLRLGEWCSARFPHATIVVSRALEQRYLERHGRPVAYVPNGFTPPRPREPDLIEAMGLEKDGYYLFLGRLVPEKGCHTLIEAFRRVPTRRQLVFAGQTSYLDDYQARLDGLAEGADDVRFLGFVEGDALRELQTNPYAVVHPSELEGLSIALLECFSYGNCLLVSDRPENLEVVGGAGVSFRTGDVDDLARRIEELDRSPERVAGVREAVRAELATRKDWPAVARDTLELYQRVIAGWRPGDRRRPEA